MTLKGRKEPEYQGGFLLDGGVHHMAAIRLVLGEVQEVTGHVAQLQEHLPPADTLLATCKLKSGTLLTCCISFGLKPNIGNSTASLTIIGEQVVHCVIFTNNYRVLFVWAGRHWN